MCCVAQEKICSRRTSGMFDWPSKLKSVKAVEFQQSHILYNRIGSEFAPPIRRAILKLIVQLAENSLTRMRRLQDFETTRGNFL